VTKDAATGDSSQTTVPIKSLGLPNRPIGVCSMIVRPRGVRSPVGSSVSRKRFCSVRKKPGAMALTRMCDEYSCAMCTANHWVKLLTAALADAYAGVLVSGRKAFMEETLRMEPEPCSTMDLPKTWLGISVPRRFRSNTQRTASEGSSKNDRSDEVLAFFLLPPAPVSYTHLTLPTSDLV